MGTEGKFSDVYKRQKLRWVKIVIELLTKTTFAQLSYKVKFHIVDRLRLSLLELTLRKERTGCTLSVNVRETTKNILKQ